MDLTGSGIHGDKIGFNDFCGPLQKRMLSFTASQSAAKQCREFFLQNKSGGFLEHFKQCPGNYKMLDRPLWNIFKLGEFAHHIFMFWRHGNRHIRWQSPRRGGPDHHAGLSRQLSGNQWELYKNGGIFAIRIFDLGLSESGLSPGTPIDRLHRLVNQSLFYKGCKRPDLLRFITRFQSKIRMRPIPKHAEALELPPLDVNELAGIGLRFLTNRQRR